MHISLLSGTQVIPLGTVEPTNDDLYERATLLAQHYFQTEHGILLPDDVCRLEKIDTDHVLVYPPSRTHMLTYPPHMLENEFALLSPSHLSDSSHIQTIWINPCVKKSSSSDFLWNLLTYRVVDEFPEFRDHIVSSANLDAALEIYPPTEEVKARREFLLNYFSHHSLVMREVELSLDQLDLFHS